jgi:hypothetical protein
MATQISGKTLLIANYGTPVQRAAAALPQSATQSIFTVIGGNVIITSLFAVITTVVQVQATTFKINALNTASTGNTDLSLAAGSDLTGAAVGTIIGFPNVNVASPAIATIGNAGVQNNEFIVGAGTLRAITTASSTGAWKWYLNYVPLDFGASVAAA